jgi:4,5-DOPA dioxygenase extradiol
VTQPKTKENAMSTLPTLFVSHGAPTFAIEPGLAGAQLAALGRAVGKLVRFSCFRRTG